MIKASLDDFKQVICCSNSFIDEFNACVIELTGKEPVVNDEHYMYVFGEPHTSKERAFSIRIQDSGFFARVKVNDAGQIEARIRGNGQLVKVSLLMDFASKAGEKCKLPKDGPAKIKAAVARSLKT